MQLCASVCVCPFKGTLDWGPALLSVYAALAQIIRPIIGKISADFFEAGQVCQLQF